jgi:hypothetical protein
MKKFMTIASASRKIAYTMRLASIVDWAEAATSPIIALMDEASRGFRLRECRGVVHAPSLPFHHYSRRCCGLLLIHCECKNAPAPYDWRGGVASRPTDIPRSKRRDHLASSIWRVSRYCEKALAALLVQNGRKINATELDSGRERNPWTHRDAADLDRPHWRP